MYKANDRPINLYLLVRAKRAENGKFVVEIDRIFTPAERPAEFKYSRLLLFEAHKESTKDLLVYLYMDRRFSVDDYKEIEVALKQKVKYFITSDIQLHQAIFGATAR